ncbi:TetR/AcrR family transcriptional regulator [Halostagnicola kamekurae]|uniref:DNA-binding transcriptional regulator, AcrR family n=1 Tax=Halostagnicola kamekurae TaxID=619731 RepID=A0A1I6Q426_9EURY|nr:TetR/AcrR family transcriptional regulator [Halostagnicola kamekurae]SFS47144.1 DNA-binding transcriptional regulator, AcrR family [Halostagnicola kamekurae]
MIWITGNSHEPPLEGVNLFRWWVEASTQIPSIGGISMADDILENPSNTREEIMAATLSTLLEHGYADLTIDKIGDEFAKSQSLIYHHYDGKDDLVLETLEFMLESFRTETLEGPIEEPREALEEVVDRLFERSIDDDERQSLAALFELRAQATHDEAYRSHFNRSDDVFEDLLVDIVEAGIERGVFQPCSPEGVAATIITLINGTIMRRSTSEDDEWVADVRSEVESYLEACVYAD